MYCGQYILGRKNSFGFLHRNSIELYTESVDLAIFCSILVKLRNFQKKIMMLLTFSHLYCGRKIHILTRQFG